jgi:hypothetical protein
MRSLVNASSSPTLRQGRKNPPLLIAWWALWLAVGFLGSISLRLTGLGMADTAVSDTLELASSLLSVPLYLLARLIVLKVFGDQAACRAGVLQATGT